MYMCVHVCICVNVWTYVYECMFLYMCISACVCTCVCVCTCMYTCVHVYMYVCACVYTCVYVCTYVFMFVYVCMFFRMWAHLGSCRIQRMTSGCPSQLPFNLTYSSEIWSLTEQGLAISDRLTNKPPGSSFLTRGTGIAGTFVILAVYMGAIGMWTILFIFLQQVLYSCSHLPSLQPALF